ncbi:hypothetical protein I4200191B4_07690 [Pseudoflavonifractor gallinarum]
MPVPIRLDPLRDLQRQPPADWCRRCGAELYGEERELCPACRPQKEEWIWENPVTAGAGPLRPIWRSTPAPSARTTVRSTSASSGI